MRLNMKKKCFQLWKRTHLSTLKPNRTYLKALQNIQPPDLNFIPEPIRNLQPKSSITVTLRSLQETYLWTALSSWIWKINLKAHPRQVLGEVKIQMKAIKVRPEIRGLWIITTSSLRKLRKPRSKWNCKRRIISCSKSNMRMMGQIEICMKCLRKRTLMMIIFTWSKICWLFAKRKRTSTGQTSRSWLGLNPPKAKLIWNWISPPFHKTNQLNRFRCRPNKEITKMISRRWCSAVKLSRFNPLHPQKRIILTGL